MKIDFSTADRKLLKRAGIEASKIPEYSIDQALDLLEAVYAAESHFVRKAAKSDYARDQAERYASLADWIFALIPEE